jgi:hypothetical protein
MYYRRSESKDTRYVLKIGRMTKHEETDSNIDWLISAYKKYAIKGYETEST